MIHASAGVSGTTLVDVGNIHSIFFVVVVSRFKKRGIATLQGGVFGIVAPVGSVSFFVRLWGSFPIALDC